ncbi:hypothetical protein AC1031_005128 [Aphanomyces cochlioides]|nr:hypothetical protein AC1031_005128 [Aphanomyces cochlioides]
MQQEIRDQLSEHRQIMAEHQQLLQEASRVVGQQRQEIGELKQAVNSPRGRARWGLFADNVEEMDDSDSIQHDNTAETPGAAFYGGIMLAAGKLPIPPTYKGCTKKEKREFMDRYLSYSRRMQALSEASGRSLALIPVGACIEHKTMVRICMFEVKKSADEMTEQDWRNYFWQAKALETAMRSLHMDTSIKDAESRILKLLTDFQAKLDGYDMDNFMVEEPKLCIKLLCNSLRPTTFRLAVTKELQKQRMSKYKKDLASFIDWLKERVAAFLMFEAHLPKHQPFDRKVAAPVVKDGMAVMKNGCLKCGSKDHKVFQCPRVKPDEAKKLWSEFKQLRLNQAKNVAAVAPTKEDNKSPANREIEKKTSEEVLCGGVMAVE